jgi:hypothetical protein
MIDFFNAAGLFIQTQGYIFRRLKPGKKSKFVLSFETGDTIRLDMAIQQYSTGFQLSRLRQERHA